MQKQFLLERNHRIWFYLRVLQIVLLARGPNLAMGRGVPGHRLPLGICDVFYATVNKKSILNTLSGRRLHWLGHTIRMDHRRITHQALYWEVPGFKRGPGRPRTNWRGIVKKDKNGVGVWPNTFTWTWDESSQVKLINNRESVFRT